MTQQTSLLCDAIDVSAVSRSGHVCCVTPQLSAGNGHEADLGQIVIMRICGEIMKVDLATPSGMDDKRKRTFYIYVYIYTCPFFVAPSPL